MKKEEIEAGDRVRIDKPEPDPDETSYQTAKAMKALYDGRVGTVKQVGIGGGPLADSIWVEFDEPVELPIEDEDHLESTEVPANAFGANELVPLEDDED